MPLSWQKKLWWGLLLLSAGGTLALTLLSLSAWMLAPPVWWVWPPLTLVSAVALRRCYRREPSNLPGFWHLRLEDLLGTALYAGLLLAVLKPLLGLLFIPFGLIFASVHAIAFIIGCLTAQRRGLTTRFHKLFFALAYGTRLVGLVATATIAVVMLMDGITFGVPFQWAAILCGLHPTLYLPHEMIGFLLLHRLTVLCFPVGIALSWAARRALESRRNETASRSAADAAPAPEYSRLHFP